MPKNIQAKNSQYDEVQKIKTLKNVMLLEKELFCIVQDKPWKYEIQCAIESPKLSQCPHSRKWTKSCGSHGSWWDRNCEKESQAFLTLYNLIDNCF